MFFTRAIGWLALLFVCGVIENENRNTLQHYDSETEIERDREGQRESQRAPCVGAIVANQSARC